MENIAAFPAVPTVKYSLRIHGLPTPDGTIPIRALLDFLAGLTDCAEKGLRLVVDGASVRAGRPPAWLEAATNFTLAGLAGGSTVLQIEAPTLDELLGDQVRQGDFWLQPPHPGETALSVVSRSIRDTTAENLESDYYDAGVLKSILQLKSFFRAREQRVELISEQRPNENIELSLEAVEKAERLKIRTPESQTFLVSGLLNRIEHSERRFRLVLGDGRLVPGRIDEEFTTAENLREHWGRKVTVRGVVHFRPSGRVQMIAAQEFRAMSAGEEIFEVVPYVQTVAEFAQEAVRESANRNWLQEIWGQWPDDEPVESLLRDTKR